MSKKGRYYVHIALESLWTKTSGDVASKEGEFYVNLNGVRFPNKVQLIPDRS